MNKIAQYLNEQLLGEVTASDLIRQKFSRDGSILNINPELIVHPRVTNDIRKVARFSWQLAEKGHVLPITIRGAGSDLTGAAIGKGIIINTVAHLNNILFINTKSKDQFIHVQPGVNFSTANEALKAIGMIIPTYPSSNLYSTIGGVVANNTIGQQSGSQTTGDLISRLEVILANGDLIETSRISKHELNKKKGLQTFEGEIYRKIDGIIEDNDEVINNKISHNTTDNTGYSGIAKVKQRDGSFDLTPLLTGSQGTLGMISEIVVKTTFYCAEQSIILATFDNPESARDAADVIMKHKPTALELIDGEIFDQAHEIGKKYIFTENYLDKKMGTVLYANFTDFSDHARAKKIKHIIKALSKFETTIYTSDKYSIDDLEAARSVSSILLQSVGNGESQPSLIDGASIPLERQEEFAEAIKELANKHHINLPIHVNWLNGIVYTRPALKLNIVSDKQKAFKLINDYMELVTRLGGCMCAASGEGRLKANGVYAQLDDDELDVYRQIKEVFDPFGILNPGIKQKNDLKTLASSLNSNYSIADFASYSPVN